MVQSAYSKSQGFNNRHVREIESTESLKLFTDISGCLQLQFAILSIDCKTLAMFQTPSIAALVGNKIKKSSGRFLYG